METKHYDRIGIIIISSIFFVTALLLDIRGKSTIDNILIKDGSGKVQEYTLKALYADVSNERLIDINKASCFELMNIPGIGKVLAKRIVDYRKTFGTYNEMQDLLKVRGIANAKLKKIKIHLKPI